jgi:hypothetical protein
MTFIGYCFSCLISEGGFYQLRYRKDRKGVTGNFLCGCMSLPDAVTVPLICACGLTVGTAELSLTWLPASPLSRPQTISQLFKMDNH